MIYHSSNKDVDISITDKALKHFNSIMAKEPNAIGIKLTVKKSGCSGMAYELDYLLKADDNYLTTSIKDVTLYIDKKYYANVFKGVEIDFISETLGQTRLDIKNPNIKSECGCKESFNVKHQEANNGK